MAGYVAPVSLSLILLLLPLCAPQTVTLQGSSVDEVPKLSTVISFHIELRNPGDDAVNASVSFKECHWEIEHNDTDSSAMLLRPNRAAMEIQPHNTSVATFMFYNLYTRFRRGKCHFEIAGPELSWQHSVVFNTYPKESRLDQVCDGAIHRMCVCEGDHQPSSTNATVSVLQDPDRECRAVDCAVKYRGQRNFYRNSTGRCERVVRCNTRGKDGVSVVAYYDWDNNMCHRFDWMDENQLSQVESDVEIPDTINASKAEYFVGFEPDKLEKEQPNLHCNNGQQRGIYCQCNDGWVSSGIDPQDPTKYHWCDRHVVPPPSHGWARPPRVLTRAAEAAVTVSLTLVNLVLALFWVYLLYRFTLKQPSLEDKGLPLPLVLRRGLGRLGGWCCWWKKQSAFNLKETEEELDK